LTLRQAFSFSCQVLLFLCPVFLAPFSFLLDEVLVHEVFRPGFDDAGTGEENAGLFVLETGTGKDVRRKVLFDLCRLQLSPGPGVFDLCPGEGVLCPVFLSPDPFLQSGARFQ
jgi:hypothetical protein